MVEPRLKTGALGGWPKKKTAIMQFFQGDTMRLDFVNERYRSETKSLAGIERTHEFENRHL